MIVWMGYTVERRLTGLRDLILRLDEYLFELQEEIEI